MRSIILLYVVALPLKMQTIHPGQVLYQLSSCSWPRCVNLDRLKLKIEPLLQDKENRSLKKKMISNTFDLKRYVCHDVLVEWRCGERKKGE